MFKFKNGDKVKDIVSGLIGVVIAYAEYLNGCKQYAVKSQNLKDGRPRDADWIDEGQLILVKKDILGIKKSNTGGPACGLTLPKI